MSPQEPRPDDRLATFGPNEWLVEEMYERYLQDPDSVDRAWWNFFADYQPSDTKRAPSGNGVTASPATAADQRPAGSRAQPTEATGRPTEPDGERPLSSGQQTQTASGQAPAPPARRESTVPARPEGGRATTEPGRGEDHGRPRRPSGGEPGPRATPSQGGEQVRLRGAAARAVSNMDASLSVPTATSVRTIPAKLLIDNRIVINNHLKRGRGGKISFTHLIGYAIVKALESIPGMNFSYAEAEGKPNLVKPEHVNLGLAIDVKRNDGGRGLVVPSIKTAETMDFASFWAAYEELVRKAQAGKLTIDDFTGTTISLTNPGMIGTVHSMPRLMRGQGCIVGVGALEYPAEYQGASPETLARLGVSKVLTLTSTYDHRVIQGALSGEFLRRVHELVLGADEFYDEIFRSLRIPYEPIRWETDISASHEDEVSKPARVLELVQAYRVRGHLMADTDPLEYRQRKHPDLDIVNHGLTLWDLEREFPTGGFGGKPLMKLREILGVLRDSYCRTVGVEYMHIEDPEERAWIQHRVERPHQKPGGEEQLHILNRLNAAEAFETFLQTKYVGQKRFSLEGGESVIPLLDAVLTETTREGLDEVVLGMAHRGRLNVLANIIGKSYTQIFQEFEGNLDPRSAHGSGDVKYHLGADGTFHSRDVRSINVSVAANASHLESVDPVLEGVVRAKQDMIDTGEEGFTVLPLLIHGDAAFAGQGVAAETLNLSQLRGYRTGGTVHVVINNQVGFTTPPTAGRSSVYATDVARMVQSPIFHVNGDDPEACVRVARLAFEYRQTFKKDVVIDLICYRRRGHNETDNPSFTQPLMYDLIDAKRSVRKLYTESLIGRGDLSVDEAERALRDYQQRLEQAFTETKEAGKKPSEPGSVVKPEPDQPARLTHADVPTAVTDEVVKRVTDTQLNLPEGFTAHPRLGPMVQRRAKMVEDDQIDWATGELLAFGSLLLDGHPVRLAGQDSRRGTFGQRHAVLVDRRSGAEYTPLKQLDSGQTKFYAYDSLLSEIAAVGFEYGYSVARPDTLVCWEAQFGDFANGAQVIIDEFITASEQKWGQQSGVVLLLPHGYEGQGPDHSSGRIERFLQMCAQDNMVVSMPSKPANYFHLLRWHVLSGWHKPLIVFTPKSLLRLKRAASTQADFTGGHFQPVIGEPADFDRSRVRRVVLCSGKVFYDLQKARQKQESDDVALVRVERLYPMPGDEIARELETYPNAADVVWVQEEPANMGPWPFMALHLPEHLGGRRLYRVTRPASSSPAAGSMSRHDEEQQAIISQIFPER
ncbi:MAG: multifunctional oxoglutarate decarboxylase/oxoglutarate dehydrogenase thiamine pyrophosphate-binding subunit/dihydrolipoyllysine-residue succinyltransferase subunit [Streptosporangiaceae bacterium]